MNFTTLVLLVSLSMVFVGIALVGIFWAIKSGQYDDMEGPAQQILMDDDDPLDPFYDLNKKQNRHRIDPN